MNRLHGLVKVIERLFVPVKTKTNVGQFLRKKRLEMGLTQNEIAERLGVTYQYISRIEVGRALPPDRTLDELAKILQLDANEFIIMLLTDYQIHFEKLLLRRNRQS